MSKTDSSVERPFPHVTGVTTMTTYMKLQEELADARHAYIDMKERALAAEAALATMIEQKEYFRQCWEATEAALAERDKPCVWKQDADKWYMTACENAFSDMQGSYCPGCGHPIEVTE